MDKVATQKDVEKWTRHFRRMAAGKLKRQPEGYYLVDGRTTPPPLEPKLNYEIISPVEQAVNLAKSELKLQRDDKGVEELEELPEERLVQGKAKRQNKILQPAAKKQKLN